MKVLMVVSGSAYGLDSTYNAIRLAGNLAKARLRHSGRGPTWLR